VVKDQEKLQTQEFSFVVCDEAQNIKNPRTGASKAAKRLKSPCRLALSGTPVENSLEDLRSIFDFILPGYLGSAEEFRDAYRTPLESKHDAETAERLRKITAPFLLRRLKTDKTIIADLPKKVIVNEYASLSPSQAALYTSVLEDAMRKLEKSQNSFARSALVLGLLTSLRQICAHPRVYDKKSPPLARLSGKALLLVTLLSDILSGGEKVLIFSQYVETLVTLQAIIQQELGLNPVSDCLLYHGSQSLPQRSAIVEAFQKNPDCRVLLISLKAGGTGLNLTAASRVIHYDLWYNPSVENQATDRAFRIGQKHCVFVHRLICRNTFEEKVEAMLQNKAELAELSVATGESWLTKLTDAELKALFMA
jgi:SNF2 family DNA or RNA helicase